MQSHQASGPLSGITVLDLTSVVMGPFATQMLADLGADVIKIESPAGDSMRQIGPLRTPKMGAMHLHLNRNKRSIVLDLKSEEGLRTCQELIKKADILIYNIRPASMQKLGLAYEDIKKFNPKIIYVGVYGFSESGPYAGLPAYDDLIQGMVGIGRLYEQSTQQEPRYAPLTLADRIVGLQAAIACLAGVIDAQKTGEGQSIEIPMFEGMAQFVLGDHLGEKTFSFDDGKTCYPRLISHHRKPYKTKDGYLCILIYNDKHWERFLTIINRPDLIQSAHFKNQTARAEHINEVNAFVSNIIQEKTSAEWQSLLTINDIPCSPLYTINELITDKHLLATKQIQKVNHPSEGMIQTTAPLGKYSKTPLAIYRHAPALGEHTAEVIKNLDLPDYIRQKILETQKT